MSYDIDLMDPLTNKAIVINGKHDLKGGTYALHGSSDLSFNITWNYVHYLKKALGERGVRTIYGMTGAESIPVLEAGIARLGSDVDEDDYWNATEGNTKVALESLLAIAMLGPNGIWRGD